MMFRLLLCVLGLWAACLSATAGEPGSFSRTWGTEAKTKVHQALPANILLSDGQFQAYQRHLSQHECGRAAGLLIRVMDRTTIQFRHLSQNLKNIFNDQIDWGIYEQAEPYIIQNYPHLYICRLEHQLRILDQRIGADDQKAGLQPYVFMSRGKTEMKFGTLSDARDHIFLMISVLVDQDYVPVFPLKARLLRLRLLAGKRDLHFEYFLLRRACYLGQPCAAFKAQLKEVAALLSPRWVCMLDQDARHPLSDFKKNRKPDAWEACGRLHPPVQPDSGR